MLDGGGVVPIPAVGLGAQHHDGEEQRKGLRDRMKRLDADPRRHRRERSEREQPGPTLVVTTLLNERSMDDLKPISEIAPDPRFLVRRLWRGDLAEDILAMVLSDSVDPVLSRATPSLRLKSPSGYPRVLY